MAFLCGAGLCGVVGMPDVEVIAWIRDKYHAVSTELGERGRRRWATDAEDVALSAFASFFRGMENHRFSNLGDRQSLWRLLVCITIRKVLHVQRDQGRLKRGGNRRAIELDRDAGLELVVIEQVVSREPSPELAAQVAEEHRRWMTTLGSEELTRLAEWKLEGFTNEEIAEKCGRTVRTVERKLNLIRKILVDDMSLGD